MASSHCNICSEDKELRIDFSSCTHSTCGDCFSGLITDLNADSNSSDLKCPSCRTRIEGISASGLTKESENRSVNGLLSDKVRGFWKAKRDRLSREHSALLTYHSLDQHLKARLSGTSGDPVAARNLSALRKDSNDELITWLAEHQEAGFEAGEWIETVYNLGQRAWPKNKIDALFFDLKDALTTEDYTTLLGMASLGHPKSTDKDLSHACLMLGLNRNKGENYTLKPASFSRYKYDVRPGELVTHPSITSVTAFYKRELDKAAQRVADFAPSETTE